MNAVLSLEDETGLRCVDVVEDGEGRFRFREFRRDPEDGGRWTLVADQSGTGFTSRDDALAGAERAVGWFTRPLAAAGKTAPR